MRPAVAQRGGSQQNPAERKIQMLKNGTKRLLDQTGAPSTLWLYALLLMAADIGNAYLHGITKELVYTIQ